MKFLHVTDTHLGYNQYGLEERGQDFFDVFDEAIDIAIENDVDFILHSGDFFHTSRPTNQVILEGLEIINKVKKANIPIFCIAGNHDRGSKVRDISPLDILKPFGLKTIENGTIEHEGIYISGLKYISKAGIKHLGGIRQVLEKLLEKTSNSTNPHILMLHQEFYPLFPLSSLYTEREIPEGFDYVGIGHYHVMQKPKNINNSFVVYPGSTEFTAYSEKENATPKGVYLVEKSGKDFEFKFIELKRRRPFIFSSFEEENFDEVINEIKYKVDESLSLNEKAPVIVLKGMLKDFTIKDLSEKFEKEGLVPDKEKILYFNFLTSRFIEETEEKVNIEIDEENIYEELRKLIEDDDLFSDIKNIITTLKSFDSLEEMKKFLKENENILELNI
jgi:DNA repair exonuclease SbcCD nuclease subunit